MVILVEDFNVLINKEHLLSSDYVPDDLYIIDNNENNFHKYKDSSLKPMLRKAIKPYLDEMVEEAKKNGFYIIVDSGYRSYEYQKKVLDALIQEKGEEAYLRAAIPGASEHQSGLAFDFAYFRNGIYSDDVTEKTNEAIWMANNSYKFGFILRYPKDKTHITGFQYEPWHFRFVGLETAQRIFEDQITLEEYHQSLTLRKKHL